MIHKQKVDVKQLKQLPFPSTAHSQDQPPCYFYQGTSLTACFHRLCTGRQDATGSHGCLYWKRAQFPPCLWTQCHPHLHHLQGRKKHPKQQRHSSAPLLPQHFKNDCSVLSQMLCLCFHSLEYKQNLYLAVYSKRHRYKFKYIVLGQSGLFTKKADILYIWNIYSLHDTIILCRMQAQTQSGQTQKNPICFILHSLKTCEVS